MNATPASTESARTSSGTMPRVTPPGPVMASGTRARELPAARPPLPTAEFAPEELEQALALARRSSPPAPPPSPTVEPQRTRSGERPAVRAAMPTPKVDLAREVLPELEPVDPSDVAPPGPALPPPAPETYGAPSESRLGVAAFPMQVAPRPVEVTRAPLVPVGPQLTKRPRRAGRVAVVVLALFVVIAAVLALLRVVSD